MKISSLLRINAQWILFTAALGFYILALSMIYQAAGFAPVALSVIPVAFVGWILRYRLRDNEARVRELLDIAFDAVVIHDQDKILDVNHAFWRVYGYERSQIIGNSVLKLIAPEDRDHVRQKIAAGDTTSYAGTVLCKDGTSLRAEIVEKSLRQRGRLIGVMVIRASTESNQAQEALHQQRQLLSTVITNLPHRIFYKDTQGRYILINRTLANIYNLTSPDEAVGKTVFDYYPTAMAARYHANDMAVIKSGQPSVAREDPSLDENGNAAWLFTTKVPVRDSHDQVIGLIGIAMDVTNLKQSEQALRDSEERYRALYHDNPSMFFTLDSNGKIISVNDYGASQLGYAIDELVGRPGLEIFLEEDRAAAAQHFQRCLQNPLQVYLWQLRKVRKDGSILWVEESARSVKSEDGSLHVLIVCREITARKQTEEALRVSEVRLSEVVRAGDIGIFDHDHFTDVHFWSPRQREIYGWGPDEVVTVPGFLEILHPEDRDRIAAAIGRAHDPAGDGFFDVEYRIFHRNGKIRWLNVRSRTFFSDEGGTRHSVRTIGATVDITERKQAEQALQISEARLREVVRVGNIGIFDHDHQTDMSYWSPEQRRIYGWKPEDVIKLPDFLRVVHPEDRDRAEAAIRRAQDPSGDGIFDVEHRILTPDGEIRWLSVRSRTYFADEGGTRHLVRTIGAIVDITERKQAEAQRLELALAQEKAESLKEFLATVSHDLKTPLSVINTTLYLLEKLTDPEIKKDKLLVINAQTERLGKLIEDILMMSQLEALPEFEFQALDVNPMIQDIENDFHSVAENKHLTIRLDLADHLPCVRADSQNLNRALVNLIENALNYSQEGGTVSIRTAACNENVMIEVIDSGIGIGAEDLSHIFERFYRADKARSAYTGGTGLGLAIVKKIIEVHGGRIEVESKLGVGSTFRVELPISEDDPAN